MNIKEILLLQFINFLIKNLLVVLLKIKKMTKQELAEELNKPIIRKFVKRKVYSPFIDNIWGADLADM